MKEFKAYIFSLLLLSILFSACEKYNYTPLYSSPPAGYYDFITMGTVYNGNLIVAGNFTTLFGSANNIAQWNGSSWQGLGSGIPGYYAQGTVTAMATYNGNLIIGGYFSSAGGQTANQIAQWNGSSWQGLGEGITWGNNEYATISALVVYNSNLIVAGSFPYAGGSSASNLAEWNGSSWSTTVGGVYNNNLYYGNNGCTVNALAVYNSNLIVGGEFDSIGTQHILDLAQWNGSSWSTLGGACNGTIYSLTVYNNKLIALGAFSSIGGASANGSAIWDGSSWSALNLGPDEYNTLSSPIVNNGTIFYDNWNYANINRESNITYQWTGSGSPATIGTCATTKETWYDQDGIETNMQPLCVYNGNLIVGGWFTSVNGVTCNYNLAQWNGTNWSSF